MAEKSQEPVTSAYCILAAKAANAEADTSVLEREIDQLVYKLYDLTPEEIAIVEGAMARNNNGASRSRREQCG